MKNCIRIRVFLFVQGLAICSVLSCKLPNGQEGECIPSKNCSGYIELLEKDNLTKNELKFLQLIQCDYESDEPNVCCTKSKKYDNITITVEVPSKASRRPYVDQGVSDRIIGGSSVLPSLGVCGIQFYDANRIVGGGVIASLDEFPWMAKLQYSNEGALCAGVLISKIHVITAAHCVTEPLLSVLGNLTHVRLGEYDITTEQDCDMFIGECADPAQDLEIENIIVHPQYGSNIKNMHNDIAIIKLAREAKYSYFVQPICLPTSDYQNIDSMGRINLYVAGWGLTEKNIPSPVKMKLKVPVVSPLMCREQFTQLKIQLTSNHLCAGGEVRKGISSGDSGGPLMVYDKYSDSWFCVGVASLGLKKYGSLGVPGVYTRVYDYIDWIRTTVDN